MIAYLGNPNPKTVQYIKDKFFGWTNIFYTDGTSIRLSQTKMTSDILQQNRGNIKKANGGKFCTEIGYYAFGECGNLEEASFSKCLKIDNYAFGECAKLSTVDFQSCTEICENAFTQCTSLKTISFPLCQKIGSNAFNGCESLENAYFPACSVIESDSFNGCSLKSICFGFTSIAANQFCNSSVEKVSFPACQTIADFAFCGCESLQQVDVPNCSSIGVAAFSTCTQLSTISIPCCLSIGDYAFNGCTNLDTIYIGTSNCQISEYTFLDTKITQSTGSIYVRSSYVDYYKSASMWGMYSSIIVGY